MATIQQARHRAGTGVDPLRFCFHACGLVAHRHIESCWSAYGDIAGERQFVMLSASNLATTQAVITRLQRDIETDAKVHLFRLPHMSDAAECLGQVNREQQSKHAEQVAHGAFNPEATYILGGQITTSAHTPFLQVERANTANQSWIGSSPQRPP